LTYKVFISHGWADRWIASQIEARLRAAGISTFIDVNDVSKGDDIEDKVFDALRQSHELFVLLTPWSVDRNWVWVEIGAARGLGLRIVVALYQIDRGTIEREKGGLAFLGARNMMDINEFESYLSEVTSRATTARS
jgi:hypothetical protein